MLTESRAARRGAYQYAAAGDAAGDAAAGDGVAVPAHFVYAARYAYSDVVVQSDNLLRLSPAADGGQQPGECTVATAPVGQQSEYADRLGNRVHRVQIMEPHRELVIAAAGLVHLPTGAPAWPDALRSELRYGPAAQEFLAASPLVDPSAPAVRAAATDAAGNARTLRGMAEGVARWIYEQIRYERGATSVRTTASDVLAAGGGVCQDQAHLALGMLRALGIPARYVSGLLTRQAGETHAWVEFRHPAGAWLPADPSRGAPVDDRSDYLKFAVGRDYSEALPVSGSFVSQGAGQLEFAAAEVFFDRDGVSVTDALVRARAFDRSVWSIYG